ncbi:MAG TPA: transglycosylase domain-containing protein [Candidatus Saccharimonadales bacterium]|nr:transglycosylase domain-containing protein [Candidatus Saccharimonadales bacterium]
MNSLRGPGRNRPRQTIKTRSGNTIKLNRTLSDRMKASRAARAAAKATYLSTLPKNRWKRLAYRMHPRRLAAYWFSREGAIMALKLIGVAVVLCFFLTIGLFAYFRKDLPKIKDIAGDNLGGSITYYDRTGKTVLWQDYDAVKRIPVESDEISKYMKDATVAIEDKDFFKHGAFDVRGIMRAGLHDVFGGGGSVQGGSTITQQLVKLNEGWTDNRTITRKVKELILAVELEREYSKDDILTGYLNIAPYGGVEYGVETAARDYFRTDAKDLTLPEAAMLAAIPQAPGYYSPYSSSKYNQAVTQDTFNKAAMLNRQHYILDQMAAQGYISQAQADAAKKVNVLALVHEQTPKYNGIKAPYFVLAAKQQLEQTFGATLVNRGGWKVITTLDLKAQKQAEQLVASNYNNAVSHGADEEATVAENVQTGQIVALVGGVDFSNKQYGQNNYAAGIKIPPGSSFKPYDYTTLINNNNNVGAGSVMYDNVGPLPGYACTNHSTPQNGGNCLQDYDFYQPGPITLRYALGGSRNIPAVKAMLEAQPGVTPSGSTITQADVNSINKVISTASDMMYNVYDQQHNKKTYNCYSDEALTQTTQCYDSSAIGDGAYLNLDDHVNGLATLARLGKAIPRTFILKITDSAGHNVAMPTYQPKQVVRQDAAYIIDNMASDPNASYLPGSCSATTCTELYQGGYKFQRHNGWDFAVKTGTTNNGYDGLMTSWSTKYAVVSWVGNHTRHVELTTDMEYLTEPLTRGLMEYLHQGLKPVNWKQPSDIKVAPAFVVRNHIHYGDIEPSPSNDIYPSWYVGGNKANNTKQTFDKVSNNLATSCTPPLARQTYGNANAATWNVDIFKGGIANVGSSGNQSNSTAQQATDDVHNCNDSPPSVNSLFVGGADISNGGSATCNLKCTVTVTVTQGTHSLAGGDYTTSPAGTVSVSFGGHTINTRSIPSGASPSYSYSFTYKPSSSTTGTLSARVVDSVLYSGTASGSLKATAPQPLTLNVKPDFNGQPFDAQFTWNNVTGATSYTLCVTDTNTNTQNCTTQSSGDVISGLVPGDKYSAKVTANDPNATMSKNATWTQ